MTEIRTGRRFPFVIVPLWVVDHPVTDKLDVTVYVAIKRHADQTGTAWPSRARIADLAKCSVESVDRSVKRLIDAGALEKEVRRNKSGEPTSNLYTIHEEPPDVVSQTRGSVSQTTGVASRRRTNLEPEEQEGDALDLTTTPDPSDWTPMPDTIRAMLTPPQPTGAA
jgi:DNA-binding transcriptional MocR family regulator